MSSRQLFSGLKLFKKEVVERFLLTTMEIYKHHPVYTYNEDESVSGILIHPSYATVEHDGKEPRFIIKMGGYNQHLMDTLNRNMSREIVRDGIVSGQEHEQIIQTNLTVLVRAYAEEESSDLADELTSIAGFAEIKMYSESGIIIRNIQVSETDLIEKENDLFQTVLSINLDIPWKFTHERVDLMEPPVLELEEAPLLFTGYRQPGVTVFKQ